MFQPLSFSQVISKPAFFDLLEGSQEQYFAFDDQWSLIFINKALRISHRLDQLEAIGQPVFDAFSWYASADLEHTSALLHTASQEKGTVSMRYTAMAAMGKLDYEVQYFPEYKESGELAFCLAKVTNVSEQEQAQLPSDVALPLLKRILEEVTDAIVIVNEETGYVFEANPSAAFLLGKPVEQLKKLHYSALFVPQDYPEVHKNILQSKPHGGGTLPQYCRFVRKGQSPMRAVVQSGYFQMHKATYLLLMINEAEVTGPAANSVLNTHARLQKNLDTRTASLEALNKSLTDELALRRESEKELLGLAEQLEKYNKGLLDTISFVAGQVLPLANELQANALPENSHLRQISQTIVAKIEQLGSMAGKNPTGQTTKHKVNFDSALAATVKTLAHANLPVGQIEETDFAVHQIMGQPQLIESLFYQLFHLADQLKMPERPLAMQFASSKEGDMVCLSMHDNGKGIPTTWNQLHHQSALQASHQKGHIGALQLLKLQVEMMGGYVEWHSIPMQGTTWRLYLPV